MREHVYSHLDLHFGKFLAGRSGLGNGERETFRSLIQELSAALAAGHSCLRVNEQEAQLLSSVPHLVSPSGPTPLTLQGDRLYLHRFFNYEQKLAGCLSKMCSTIEPLESDALLDSFFGDASDDDLQKEAGRVSLERKLSIISGGPGTGKTSTVLKIIALLVTVYGKDLKIGLAAPTGKAAARLSQSLVSGRDANGRYRILSSVGLETMTLHRLLGVVKYSPSFLHHLENPLNYDVVIVDEASMVDLAMMAKLVDSLNHNSRLILLGDKDQLASVEAGSIMADLVTGLPDNTTTLTKSYRFDGAIGRLAELINTNRADDAWSLLCSTGHGEVVVNSSPATEELGRRYEEYMKQAGLPADGTNCRLLLAMFNRFQLLCAVRKGNRGVDSINGAVERYLSARGFNCTGSEFYPGRPVLISQNNYSLNLFNGDIGICLADQQGRVKVWFEQYDGTIRSFLPHRLPRCETAFAMSIHKSQGSEFDEAVVVLPKNDSPVLSRELVYTAVTRARKRVELICSKEIFTLSVQRRVERGSGLKRLLEQIKYDQLEW